MDNDYIDKITLYDLFFRKPINIVTYENSQQTQQIQQTHQLHPNNLTPIKQKTQSLLSLLSPEGKLLYKRAPEEDKEKLLNDLVKDTNIVENMEMLDYMNDLDYKEKMENNMLGFYMESFISCYGKCPVCKQKTLRKYNMSNMPVIDLICTNFDYHYNNGGCFMYQLKTSIDSNYFNKNHITVGSKRFGYNSHIVKGSDDDNKKLLVIGYICLFLTQNENNDNNNKYKINKSKSFVLIPDLKSTLDEHYYSYGVNYFGKNIIRWNSKLVTMNSISNCINNIDNMNVDTNKQFSEIIIENPYKYIPNIKLGSEWKKYKNRKNRLIKNPNPTKKFKLTNK